MKTFQGYCMNEIARAFEIKKYSRVKNPTPPATVEEMREIAAKYNKERNDA